MKKIYKILTVFLLVFSCCVMAEGTNVVGSWFLNKSQDKLTDEQSVNAWILDKNAYTKNGLGRDVSIVARCTNSKTEVYVGFEDVVSYDGTDVAYRIDNNKAIKENWSRSEGGQGLFSKKPINFLKSINNHEKLVFGFSPYASQMVAVEFNITGINEVIKEISTICKWKM